MDTTAYARWFRGSMPYISGHRNKTFVVMLSGEAIAGGNLTNIVHDLALLHVLGVRLVLVHGARSQIDEALPGSRYHGQRRVTDADGIDAITAIYGQMRARLEALFSTGLPNSPQHNVDVHVVTGNFVTAQPIGLVDGVDHLFTGRVRRVHAERLRAALASGGLVLQAPLGYSPSGQAFNLAASELAAEIAIALKADKLICFDKTDYLVDEQGERISTLSPGELQARVRRLSDEQQIQMDALRHAVVQGVTKAHLISYEQNGALLAELFTPQGVGTQIVTAPARAVRPANLEDVADIVEMIRPLEESGSLVRRERDRLEQEIGNFLVAELDEVVVGCCAVYAYGEQAELACVAVSENYRNQTSHRIGSSLLDAARDHARAQGAQTLFVLTTQTRDWFLEQGFSDAQVEALPAEKQHLYNWQRNSRVMLTQL